MSDGSSARRLALLRVLGQHLAGPPDEAGGGLVAGPGDDGDVHQELVPAEAPHGAGLVLELGVEQVRHDVVGRVLGPPVDVGLELRAVGEALRHVHRLALLGAEVPVDLVADGLLVLVGHAQQHPDDAHRHHRAEVADEVEAPAPDVRIEAVRAELADLRLQGRHLLRGEHPRQQAAVDRVRRRVLEDDDARRHLDVRLDDLEDRAAPGDERVPVDGAALDVLVAAQRVEVVRLVVVERRLLPEAAERRVRVGVDRRVVRVVVQVARCWSCSSRGAPRCVEFVPAP